MGNTALQHWLDRLEKLHPSEIELGLERITLVANRLGLLPVSRPVITVAGTNGKGTTVAVLEALLAQTQTRCGSFTSPHFQRFNERIRINGAEAPDEVIVRAFEAIDAARESVSLTYFEFAALAALLIFSWEDLDMLVLEVGLGGRLDAVNIVDPAVAVITSIALDHQNWLGDTRDEIAIEKAGILRSGAPAVIADANPPQSLVDTVQSAGAHPAVFLGKDFQVSEPLSGRCEISLLRLSSAAATEPSTRTLPPVAVGGLLPENVAAALQAAELSGLVFSDEDVERALANIALAGRRQSLQREGVHYVLDVAHNPAAIECLLEYLEDTISGGRKIAVFSVMGDKDYVAMLKLAAMCFDAWMLADQPDNERAAAASVLARELEALGVARVSHSKNLRQALARAQQLAAPGDCIVVFGSFTTVAAALQKLTTDNTLREAG